MDGLILEGSARVAANFISVEISRIRDNKLPSDKQVID